MSAVTSSSSGLLSSTMTSITATAGTAVKSFTFGTTDYIVFVIMLCISTGIGIYFGFFSKSKNTTDEYLMGSKKLKTIPIAISLVASQLSGIAIMSVPAESYSFGFNYIFLVMSMLLVVPTLCWIIIPVFYENNISSCYEYLQLRFNKGTRQIVTAAFVFNGFLILPVYIFVPSLAFSQVTDINLHLINAVVCSICVFYTMLGGIKAVVWTDVVQAGIMLSSVVLVGVLGTIKTGGLTKVIELAAEGGRMDFTYSWDPRIRITVWNALIGGAVMWTGHIGLNQSCVQRIVSLPSLQHAKRSLCLAGVGFIVIMGFNCFIGIVMFARYFGCDPIAAGLVEKADKLVPFFVQDIMGHLKGMPGLFISCVFSAALSTMSANLNSLAGVVYFDYVKPFIKHTEERANFVMKLFVIATGCYCIVGGLVVQKFNSILQLVITISGISTGAMVGVFLLGMFVPRVNGKVAIISVACSIFAMAWIVVNTQVNFNNGVIKYSPLPTSTDKCEAQNIQVLIKSFTTEAAFTTVSHISTTTEVPRQMTTAFGSNRDFSFYDVSFYWYKVIGVAIVWLVAIPLSYILKYDEHEKLNPKLFTPIMRRFINYGPRVVEGVPLKVSKSISTNEHENTTIYLPEKENC